MVNLVNAIRGDNFNKIMNMYYKLSEKPGFSSTDKRIIAANYAYLIQDDNKDAGFIIGVPERKNKLEFLAIDMVLLEEFRNKGIGSKALSYLVNAIVHEEDDRYIIGEIKKENIASNKISEKVGALVKKGDANYYVFPKEKKEEFLNTGYLEKLDSEAINAREIVREYHEKKSKTLKLDNN